MWLTDCQNDVIMTKITSKWWPNDVFTKIFIFSKISFMVMMYFGEICVIIWPKNAESFETYWPENPVYLAKFWIEMCEWDGTFLSKKYFWYNLYGGDRRIRYPKIRDLSGMCPKHTQKSRICSKATPKSGSLGGKIYPKFRHVRHPLPWFQFFWNNLLLGFSIFATGVGGAGVKMADKVLLQNGYNQNIFRNVCRIRNDVRNFVWNCPKSRIFIPKLMSEN